MPPKSPLSRSMRRRNSSTARDTLAAAVSRLRAGRGDALSAGSFSAGSSSDDMSSDSSTICSIASSTSP